MRHLTQALLVGLTIVLGGLDAGAFLRHGDVVIAQPGGLVRLDPATGVMLPLPMGAQLQRPTGIAVLPDGDLLIADWGLPNENEGSVLRLHVLDGSVATLHQGLPLNNPFAFARGPDGRIVLADIDAGTRVEFPNVLRRGALFDLDPVTGALVRVVQDCCEWNPVAIAFTSSSTLFVADAGCCAYAGAGQLASADLITGQWTALPSLIGWRDPFAIALASNGATAYVAESSLVQPGLPSIHVVDVATGASTMLVEGPPLDAPTGMLLEDDAHLLVAESETRRILRVTIPTGAITTVAADEPLTWPATVTRFDVGDVVSGVTAVGAQRAMCNARAAHDVDQLTLRLLRCVADGTNVDSCVSTAVRRWPIRAATVPGCVTCIDNNRIRLEATLPAALLRTPGQHMACAGNQRGPRRKLARATGILFKERSACAADHLRNGRNADRLQRCQDGAMAAFRTRTDGRCDAASLQQVAAEVASTADSLIGAWYCAP